MDEDNQFHRALKNPLVMIGLCLIAGITLYSNVIEPAMHSSVTPSVAFTPSLPETNLVADSTSHQGHKDDATQWVDDPHRDPFAPMSAAKRSKQALKPSSISTPLTQRNHEELTNRLTLKAVALEAQQRSAVINRSVVYEGEMIEGYQVVAIQLTGVWLTRHGKKTFLRFTTNTAS